MKATLFHDSIEIVGFEDIEYCIDAWDDIFCFNKRLELPTTESNNNVGSAIFMIKGDGGIIEYKEDLWYSRFYGLCWTFDVSWTLHQRKKYTWFILKRVQQLLEGLPIVLRIDKTSKVYTVTWSEKDPFNDILERWDFVNI